MTDKNERSRTNRIRSAFLGIVDSVREARRLQADMLRKYPHLR
ncbi:hypothetical protein [Fulvimarina sp. MAC3]